MTLSNGQHVAFCVAVGSCLIQLDHDKSPAVGEGDCVDPSAVGRAASGFLTDCVRHRLKRHD